MSVGWDSPGETQVRRVSMNIGEQRRTVYIEPIEDPEAWPIQEPSPALEPAPGDPEPATPAETTG